MDISLYLEHLSDADLALLESVSGHDRREIAHGDSELLAEILRSDSVHHALFGGEHDAMLRASPFLLFAVLVHRAAHDLRTARFVEEWMGPGRRLPMFEVEPLRNFAAQSAHRLFLAELLASYTRVASGSFWLQTNRGWRRRRFSELDPLRLIELLETVPDHERATLYRRLGDTALFLTGVFPDYVGQRFLSPIPRQRLLRAVPDARSEEITDTVQLLEELGRHSYRLARGTALLEALATNFGHARRLLNVVTDRYLFPYREQWFGMNS